MEKNTGLDSVVPLLGEDWFDPLEAGVRQRIRSDGYALHTRSPQG